MRDTRQRAFGAGSERLRERSLGKPDGQIQRRKARGQSSYQKYAAQQAGWPQHPRLSLSS